MRKTFCSIFTACALFSFADESTDPVPMSRSSQNLSFCDEMIARKGFVYAQFAVGENDLIHTVPLYPGIGIGYRRLAWDGAIDISINIVGRIRKREDRFFLTAPKVSYIHYLHPNAMKSAYIGGGLAWGRVSARGNDFIGIIPNFTTGYEFLRKTSFLCFSELTISQPMLSVEQKGSFPGPSIEISTGIGF